MKVLLVADGDQRGALAAARSFGRGGAAVGVAAPQRGLAGASRWCHAFHRIPAPEQGLSSFVDSVAGAIQAGNYEIVFPLGDAELLGLSAARDRLGAKFPYADHETVVRAFDKISVTDLARSCGMTVPVTVVDEDDLPDLTPPVIVKQRLHGATGDNPAAARVEAAVATSLDEAKNLFDLVRSRGGVPFAQEIISGDLMAYIALTDSGRVIHSLQQRAIRTWPLGAGITARAITVPLDDGLARSCESLLSSLGWLGAAELQFITPPTGPPRFIDFNGRFYGSMALAVAAGCDLPMDWARLSLGQVVAGASPTVTTRYQWLEGDLRRALVEKRGGIIHDLSETLRFAPSAAHSIMNLHDPKPTLSKFGDLARRVWSKVR